MLKSLESPLNKGILGILVLYVYNCIKIKTAFKVSPAVSHPQNSIVIYLMKKRTVRRHFHSFQKLPFKCSFYTSFCTSFFIPFFLLPSSLHFQLVRSSPSIIPHKKHQQTTNQGCATYEGEGFMCIYIRYKGRRGVKRLFVTP